MILGSHVSIAGSLAQPFLDAQEIGCDSIQVFVKPPRRLRGVKPFTREQIQAWEEARRASPVKAIVVHANYLINLGAAGAQGKVSRDAFLDEMRRCHALAIPVLIFHPGAHTGAGEEKGLQQVAKNLQACLKAGRDYADVTLCLENTAGQGTTLGHQLEHLRRIMDLVGQPERMGACIDTQHLLAAGYEVRTEAGYAKTMEQVEELLGLPAVKAFHLNDSKVELGSRIDRHEAIGKGRLGNEFFRRLLQDPRWRDVPGVLETPHEDNAGFRKDLRRLRKLEAGERAGGQQRLA